MHAFIGSRVIPIRPCMALLPRSFSLTIYNFYCVIYFDIGVLLMILFVLFNMDCRNK